MGSEPRESASSETIVTTLVQRENERLTRLLRNLYQEFRLGRGDQSRLYAHICRELAQYFQCDCCQLYLVRQESTGEFLELAAAFGPWEQALKPRFVRRVLKMQYPLDDALGHTAHVFRDTYARVDRCRAEYRQRGRGGGGKGMAEDAEWHLVWRRDNLYSISRNMLSCPILRHRSLSPHRGGQPYAVGVIKLENRRPLLSRAFSSDYPANNLYLGPFFELAAVAGYIGDLQRRVGAADTVEALFAPLHDSDGWRQHYEEHNAGKPYFEAILQWQHETHDEQKGELFDPVAEKLRDQYGQVVSQLAQVMDLIVEVEVLLQEVAIACCAVWMKQAPRDFGSDLDRLPADAPAPSLFNAVGLAKAWEAAGGEAGGAAGQEETALDWLRDVIASTLDGIVQGCDPRERPVECCQTLVSELAKRARPQRNCGTLSSESLWSRLARLFEERNGPLSGLLGPERRVLARAMCHWIEKAALEVRSRCSSVTGTDLTPALNACLHAAEGVLRERGDPRQPGDWTIRLARASAAACMHAHTFNPLVDAVRVYSIQSHVAQVLDNYLMDKARVSDLGISFNHIEILGLTESSLKELEHLQKLLTDVARSLEGRVRRYLAAEHATDIARTTLRPTARNVGSLLDDLVSGTIEPAGGSLSPWLARVDVSCEAGPTPDDHREPRVSLEQLKMSLPSLLRPECEQERVTLLYDVDMGLFRGSRPSPLWLAPLNASLQNLAGGLLSR